MPIPNKPIASMRIEIKVQKSVLRKNVVFIHNGVRWNPHGSNCQNVTRHRYALAGNGRAASPRCQALSLTRQHLTARLVSFPQYALKCIGETTPTARPLPATKDSAIEKHPNLKSKNVNK